MTYLDRSTPVAGIDAPALEPEPRDLLDDPVQVLGNDQVPAADVPARLRELAPGHPRYRQMNGVKLRETLEREHGVKVASTTNRYPIDPQAIRTRVAERAAE